MRRPGDSAHQFTLDWTATVDIPQGASSARSFGFDCSALRFAEMEIVRLRARSTLNAAVKAGTIKRPDNCQRCLGSGKLTGHHHDYARPLIVTWLCVKCHRKETREIAARARASLPNLVHAPGFKGTPSWIVRAIRKADKERGRAI
jgi:hypothetical protein